MAKRFIASDLWLQPWFRPASNDAKLLYLYLCTACDPSGLTPRDDGYIKMVTGIRSVDKSLDEINSGKIRVVQWGDCLFLISFLNFQFGTKRFRARDAGVNRLTSVGILKEDGRYTQRFEDLIKSLESDNKEGGNTDISSSIGSISSSSNIEDTIDTSTSTELACDLKERIAGKDKKQIERAILSWMESKTGFGMVTHLRKIKKLIALDWGQFVDALGRFEAYFWEVEASNQYRYSKRWGNLLEYWSTFSNQGEYEAKLTKLKRVDNARRNNPVAALPSEDELCKG